MKRFLSNVRRAGASEPLGEFGKMKVHVASSSNPNRLVDTIDDLPDDATVRDLKEHFHKRQKKLHPNRQRFATLNKTFFEEEEEETEKKTKKSKSSFKGEPLIPDSKKLSEFGIGYGLSLIHI